MVTETNIIFKKSDFLNASQLVKELDNQYDAKTIEDAMKRMRRDRVQIVVNHHKTEAVYDSLWTNTHAAGEKKTLRLHPAQAAKLKLQEYLAKGK